MNAFVVILFALICFTALEFPRFFLRKYKSLSSSELRDAGKGVETRVYPWSQLLYSIVSGVALFLCGVLLWPYFGVKVYVLAGAWAVQLGVFDGSFAVKTSVYPIPQRIGYYYVVGDDEHIRKLGKIHLCVGVTFVVATLSWIIFL